MILLSEISYSGDFVPCDTFLLSILTCLVTIGKELTIQPIVNRENTYTKSGSRESLQKKIVKSLILYVLIMSPTRFRVNPHSFFLLFFYNWDSLH